MGFLTKRKSAGSTSTRRHQDEQRSLTRSQQPWPQYGDLHGWGSHARCCDADLDGVCLCAAAGSQRCAAAARCRYRRLDNGGRERYSGRIADLLTTPSPGNVTYNLVSTIVAHL